MPSDSRESKDRVAALVIYHHTVGVVGVALLRKQRNAQFENSARATRERAAPLSTTIDDTLKPAIAGQDGHCAICPAAAAACALALLA